MTYIFTENGLLASTLLAIALLVSQLNVVLIKQVKGNKIEGFDHFFANSIAYSNQKMKKSLIYFFVIPAIVFTFYFTFNYFSYTGFLFRAFVFLISGFFSLSFSLTLALFITAFMLHREGYSIINFLEKMYVIVMILGLVLGMAFIITSESFYLDALIFTLFTGYMNYLRINRAKKLASG